MKKLILLFLLIILTLSFATAQDITIIDYETFEDYPAWTASTQGNNYTWDQDETEGDGVLNKLWDFLGADGADNEIEHSWIVFTPNEDFTANRIYLELAADTNAPELENIVYEVYICSLVNSTLSQNYKTTICSSTPELVNHEFNASGEWGSVNGFELHHIDIKNYDFSDGITYGIYFKYIGTDIVGDDTYRLRADDSGVTPLRVLTRTEDTTILEENYIAGMYLYYDDNTIHNLRLYNEEWDCADPTFTDLCLSITGDGDGGLRIDELNNNNYLVVQATDSTTVPKLQNGVRWDHAEFNQLGNRTGDKNITLYFKMRLLQANFNLATANQEYAGIFPLGNVILNTSPSTRYSYAIMGGFTINNASAWQSLRLATDFTNILPKTGYNPFSLWHEYNYIYNIDENNIIDSVHLYVDGVKELELDTNYQYVNTTQLFSFLRFYAVGDFEVAYDDIYLIEGAFTETIAGQELVELEDLTICPYPECIFYDDFTYSDNYSISEEGYYHETQDVDEIARIWDDQLYLEFETFNRYIRNDFDEHLYDTIAGVYKINIQPEPTPDSLLIENTPIIYRLSILCDDAISFNSVSVAFINDEDFAQNENQTVVNIYVYDEGVQRILGTLIVDNGDDIYVKTEHDTINQETKYSFITNSLLSEGFEPNYLFTINDENYCADPTSFEIMKTDSNNQDESFIRFDTVFYLGIVETDEEQSPYVGFDGNETKSEYGDLDGTEMTDTDIADHVQAVAWSLGFRSLVGKLLFWIIITFALIVGVLAYKGIDGAAKSIILSLIGLSMIFAGWKLKFIPNILMIMLVLILALVGAFIFQRSFQSSGTG